MTDPWIIDAEFEVVTPPRAEPLKLEGPSWLPRDWARYWPQRKRNRHFKGAPDGWLPEHMREPMWKRTGRLWFIWTPYVSLGVMTVIYYLWKAAELVSPGLRQWTQGH
jgi:hypothetical protein